MHRPDGTPHPRGGPTKPPSVLTPLVPLHYSTCGEGKGALPGLFYATAAMMQGHAQLHMNPGIHSHAAKAGGRYSDRDWASSMRAHAEAHACRPAAGATLPSRTCLPLERRGDLHGGGRVHRGRERAPLCLPSGVVVYETSMGRTYMRI